MFQISNDSNILFNVRVVQNGDKYGRQDCLTHKEDEPLVEFYDASFIDKDWPRGQFISSYYLETLQSRYVEYGGHCGICLDGGSPNVWYLDGGAMKEVLDWIERNNKD